MSDLVKLPNAVPYEKRCILCREGKALTCGVCSTCKRDLIIPHALDFGLQLDEAIQDYLESKKK